jgi:hypothetical protein
MIASAAHGENGREKPKFDPSKLEFPSDKITMGKLREFYPYIFHDRVNMDKHDISDLGVTGIIAMELNLSENAFRVALGEKGMSRQNRHLDIMALHDDYVTYGVTSGPKQTMQMVRRLEADAAKLAKQTGI